MKDFLLLLLSSIQHTFSQLYASKHTVVMEPGSVRSCAFVVISWIAIASLASCFSVDDTKDDEFKVRRLYSNQVMHCFGFRFPFSFSLLLSSYRSLESQFQSKSSEMQFKTLPISPHFVDIRMFYCHPMALMLRPHESTVLSHKSRREPVLMWLIFPPEMPL